MQRQVSILALLLCLALVMSACASGATPTATSPAATSGSDQAKPRVTAEQGSAPTATTGAEAEATSAPVAQPLATTRQNQNAAAMTATPILLIDEGAEFPAFEPAPTFPANPEAPLGSPLEDPYDDTFYQSYDTNPFIDTVDDKLSTFAMDVDTASYTVMRRYLTDGYLPDPDSVRVEEYVNFFDYQYPAPAAGRDFAIYMEAGPSVFSEEPYDMIQVGIQGRSVEVENRKPAHLTFVIDVSGSMQVEDRLGTVKQALAMLVEQMTQEDTIAIAVYGSVGVPILPPTPGSDKQLILDAINRLVADGSTNAEGGLDVGFDFANQAFNAEHINMVLLCSDGVANNGITDPEMIIQKFSQYIDRGIQLSTFGFGMGNYNDILMEQLANKGDGAYAYIDDLDEARRIFVANMTGTLQSIARDAKIQVEFNPAVVSRYRLLGYENRAVADNDFRNDTVDAGEVGAGHSVTALYEVKRIPGAQGPLATVRIRYQRTESPEVVEEAATLESSTIQQDVSATSPRFRLALSVAQYAELLRHSYWSKGETLDSIRPLVQQLSGELANSPEVGEFVTFLEKAIPLPPAQ
jgi:Ca-activated chloride channel homolog